MEKMSFSSRRPCCGKAELAQAYFPELSQETACRNLRRWIQLNKELSTRLVEAGYSPRAHYLTSRQVSIIYDVLGEP